MKSALQPYFGKRDFKITSEPQGGKPSTGALDFRDPEARRDPPALRLPPRARRHAEELGGAEGAEPRPGRQADGGACRGPPDRLRPLRGNDPEGAVRRGRGDRLGQRHLGAGRRPARRLPRRQAQVPPRRQEAARRLDAGADARPRRRAAGAVAADQGKGRRGAAGRRVQRRRGRAEERALGPDDRRQAGGVAEGSVARRFDAARQGERGTAAQSAGRDGTRTGTAAASKAKKSSSSAARASAPEPIALPASAVKAKLPETFSPQLATLVSEAPSDGGWIYEIKFDGYRIVARVDGDDVRLFTRRGNDWSARMPGLVAAVRELGIGSGWLDGEIVVTGSTGTPDFNALQNAFDSARTDDIQYYVFDLPYCAGHDLRSAPLVERRAVLAALLDRAPAQERVRYSQDFDSSPKELLQNACRMRLEGMIGKRADSPYVRGAARPGSSSSARSGRSSSSAAGPTRKARARESARSCSASTTRPGTCASPAASAAASTRRRSPPSSRRWRRFRPRRRRSSRSRATFAATGSSPFSSPRSRSASGLPTAASATRSSTACATTRTRARSAASRRSRRRDPGDSAAKPARQGGGAAAAGSGARKAAAKPATTPAAQKRTGRLLRRGPLPQPGP